MVDHFTNMSKVLISAAAEKVKVEQKSFNFVGGGRRDQSKNFKIDTPSKLGVS